MKSHLRQHMDKKYSLLPNSGKIILRDQSSHDIEIGKYYEYFLNIKNRILLGGGRSLDLKTENTSSFGKYEILHFQN